MDFKTFNPEVIIWAIVIAVALYVFTRALAQRSGARNALMIHRSMGTWSGSRFDDDFRGFDNVFNAIGNAASSQVTRRILLSGVVIIACVIYFLFRLKF
jgi:hypothetical protein